MNRDADEIIFDWDRDRVLRGKIETRITGQQKELLRLLVDGDTSVICKDVLLKCIWGGRAPYVDELYLIQLVYRLRKSLSAVGLGRHIVTVPRRGYRFVPATRTPLAHVDAMSRLRPVHDHGPVCLFSRPGVVRPGVPRLAPIPGDDAALHVDASRGVVAYGQVAARLTRLELRLLAALTQQPDTVLLKEEIIAKVWGANAMIDGNSLTQLVSRLRRSLHPLGLDSCVAVVPKVGYQFSCTRVPAAAACLS